LLELGDLALPRLFALLEPGAGLLGLGAALPLERLDARAGLFGLGAALPLERLDARAGLFGLGAPLLFQGRGALLAALHGLLEAGAPAGLAGLQRAPQLGGGLLLLLQLGRELLGAALEGVGPLRGLLLVGLGGGVRAAELVQLALGSERAVD